MLICLVINLLLNLINYRLFSVWLWRTLVLTSLWTVLIISFSFLIKKYLPEITNVLLNKDKGSKLDITVDEDIDEAEASLDEDPKETKIISDKIENEVSSYEASIKNEAISPIEIEAEKSSKEKKEKSLSQNAQIMAKAVRTMMKKE